MTDPEEIRKVMIEYFETFGEEIEDIRSMDEETARRVPEFAAQALARGSPLTREELGLGDPLPPEITI
jgi:hypothetical protein